MAEVVRDPEVLLLDHSMHQCVDFVKVVTETKAVRLNFECVQGCQVHSVENPLGLMQPLLQPTLDESFVKSLLQKVVLFLVLQPKDAFVQRSVAPCTQTSSGNLRKEVTVIVVVVELVAEDVAVVVAVVHCHVSCFDDETADPENQCHGQSQCFRQLAPMWFEERKAETEHLGTQKDELPLMK